jgi:WD40 repeat protein
MRRRVQRPKSFGMPSRSRWVWGAMFLVWAWPSAQARENAPQPVSFSREIAPILLAKCVACHGPEKSKSKFRLDTFDYLMKPGSSEEPVLVAGQPEKSHLFALVTTAEADDRMPQKDDPLPPDKIELLRRWIQEGARFDGPNQKAGLASYAGPADQPAPPPTYPRPVPVLALAFCPDGSELAVGGYHEVTIWDPLAGKLLRRLTNIAERTQSLAWHPRRPCLAVAGGAPGRNGQVRLIDPANGKLLHLLCRTPDVMLSVAFSPDGSHLAAAGADNAIRVFNVTNGLQEQLIEQHSDWVMDVAYSPEGDFLVSASRDKTARVFRSQDGELEESYQGHNEPVYADAVRADGKRVFSGGRGGKVHEWTLDSAQKKGEIGGLGEEVYRLLRSDDSLFIATSDREVRQYRIGGKAELLHTFRGHWDMVYALAVHAPSHRLASGSYDGEVRLWNTENGELIRAFTAAPQGP